MKHHLPAFAHDIHEFCAHPSDGLVTVGIIRRVLVIATKEILARGRFSQTLASLLASYQMPLEYH